MKRAKNSLRVEKLLESFLFVFMLSGETPDRHGESKVEFILIKPSSSSPPHSHPLKDGRNTLRFEAHPR